MNDLDIGEAASVVFVVSMLIAAGISLMGAVLLGRQARKERRP